MSNRQILSVFFGLLAVTTIAIFIVLIQSSEARKATRVAESVRKEQIGEQPGYDSFPKNSRVNQYDHNENSESLTAGKETARLLDLTKSSENSPRESNVRSWLIAGKKIDATFKEKAGEKLIFRDAVGNEITATFDDLPEPHQLDVMEISGWGHLWHDSAWKHTTIAHLVQIVDEQIVLERPNGSRLTVPFDRLSAVDRKYVDQQRDRFAKFEQLAEAKRIEDQAKADAAAKEAAEKATADAKKAIKIAKADAAAKEAAEKKAKIKRQLSRVENRYIRLRGKKPTEVGLNDEGVLVGDVYWSVHEATVLGDTIYNRSPFTGSLKTSGTFLWVEVWVVNTGNAPITLLAPNVFDDDARLFSSSTDAILCIPEDKSKGFLHNLNPGVRARAIFVYDVPKDATGLTLLVGDLELFKGKEGAIDLGL